MTILILSKCAYESISSIWINQFELEIQDKHCGCTDCQKRANRIFNETGKRTRTGQYFQET